MSPVIIINYHSSWLQRVFSGSKVHTAPHEHEGLKRRYRSPRKGSNIPSKHKSYSRPTSVSPPCSCTHSLPCLIVVPFALYLSPTIHFQHEEEYAGILPPNCTNLHRVTAFQPNPRHTCATSGGPRYGGPKSPPGCEIAAILRGMKWGIACCPSFEVKTGGPLADGFWFMRSMKSGGTSLSQMLMATATNAQLRYTVVDSHGRSSGHRHPSLMCYENVKRECPAALAGCRKPIMLLGQTPPGSYVGACFRRPIIVTTVRHPLSRYFSVLNYR